MAPIRFRTCKRFQETKLYVMLSEPNMMQFGSKDSFLCQFQQWITITIISSALVDYISLLQDICKQCMKICYSFRGNSYGPWTPTKCDAILILTSIQNKVCRNIAYCNTKMLYLSDFKRTKSKTLRTASRRMANWTKPPCDPLQIIRTKDWYF